MALWQSNSAPAELQYLLEIRTPWRDYRRVEEQVLLEYVAEREGPHVARAQALLNLLAQSYQPLAKSIAYAYWAKKAEMADLLGTANVGLVKAFVRFVPGEGAFEPYAQACIRGELKRYFRDCTWAMYVPRPAKELALLVLPEIRRLQAAGREPTDMAVAAALELPLEDVRKGLQAAQVYHIDSLERLASFPEDEGLSGGGERFGLEEHGYARVLDLETLRAVWSNLPTTLQRVIFLRFFEGYPQHQIAREIGYSQMHVSRLLQQALGRLQKLMAADPEDQGKG